MGVQGPKFGRGLVSHDTTSWLLWDYLLVLGSWARLARLSFVIVHLRDDRDGTEGVKDEYLFVLSFKDAAFSYVFLCMFLSPFAQVRVERRNLPNFVGSPIDRLKVMHMFFSLLYWSVIEVPEGPTCFHPFLHVPTHLWSFYSQYQPIGTNSTSLKTDMCENRVATSLNQRSCDSIYVRQPLARDVNFCMHRVLWIDASNRVYWHVFVQYMDVALFKFTHNIFHTHKKLLQHIYIYTYFYVFRNLYLIQINENMHHSPKHFLYIGTCAIYIFFHFISIVNLNRFI